MSIARLAGTSPASDALRRIYAARIRARGDGFECMAHAIEAGGSDHFCRQRPGDVRVDQGYRRDKSPRNDAGLRVHRLQVEDGDADGFGAGSRGGRAGNVRLDLLGTGNLLAGANGRVDICHEVRRVGRIKVRGLAGVHDGPASYRDIAVYLSVPCKPSGGLKRGVRRLDRDFVEHDAVEVRGGERRSDGGKGLASGDVLVGEERDPRHTQFLRLLARFAQGPRAKREGRHADGEPPGRSLQPGRNRHGSSSWGILWFWWRERRRQLQTRCEWEKIV